MATDSMLRPGESGGVDFWLTKLTSGESRAGVLLGFSDSSGNVSKTEQAFSLIAKAGDYPDSGGPPGGQGEIADFIVGHDGGCCEIRGLLANEYGHNSSPSVGFEQSGDQ